MPLQPRPDLVEKAIVAIQLQWNDRALRVMRSNFYLHSFTDLGVKQLLRDYICKHDGKCKERKGTDEDWLDKHPDDPWWYFVVVPVPQFPKGLFVKMRLLWEEGDLESDAYAEIIGVHEAGV